MQEANRKAKLSSSEAYNQGKLFYDTSSSATIGLTLTVTPLPKPPAELRKCDQWVSWNDEHDPKKPAEPRKPPVTCDVDGNLSRIAVTDSQNYRSWRETQRHTEHWQLAGIGFVFTENDPFCGVDLDGCRDPETGEVEAWATQIIQKLKSYSEVSPSGTGIKIWLKGKKPAGPNKWYPFPGDKNRAIEVYDSERYFTFTGQALGGYTTIQEAQISLYALCACAPAETSKRTAVASVGKPRNQDVPPAQILQRIKKARPTQYEKLFVTGADDNDNGSVLDFQLACLLVEQVGNDPERIEDLMHESAIVREKWERHDYLPRTITRAVQATAAKRQANETVKLESPKYWNDITVSKRFADQERGTLRYCLAWKSWLVWDGRRWVRDHEMSVQERLKDYALDMLSIAATERDDTRRKELMQIFNGYTRWGRLKDLEMSARSVLAIKPNELDTSHWLLNVLNGTLNLHTARIGRDGRLHVDLQPHDPMDLLTKLAPVHYEPGVVSERWQRFLTLALRRNTEIDWDDPLATAEADQELEEYAQELAGVSLTGDVRDDTLLFAHGDGGSGKSTFMLALQHLLGDYAITIEFETLLRQPFGRAGEAHRDLARLAGVRAAFASEVDEGRRWDLGMIKQLTGGDKQRGRRLYGEAFEYAPTAKIWCRANAKPAAYDSEGLWRRMRLLPFDHPTPPEHRDKTLRDALLDGSELTGILTWALMGLARWLERGKLPTENELPARIRAATDAYRKEQVDDDPLAPFFEERCVIKPKKTSPWTSSTALYGAMELWWRERSRPHNQLPTQKAFGAALRHYGLQDETRRPETGQPRVRGWCGIALRERNIQQS